MIMDYKFLEITDSMTWIPVIAFKIKTRTSFECRLMGLSGYGHIPDEYIFLMKIYGERPEVNHDVYGWEGSARTMPVAHQYLYDHWDEIKSGEMIAVEKIIEKTEEKPPVKGE
jgi:hypothetical protein